MKYSITLQRFINGNQETFQTVLSGTLSEVIDQLLNFVVGFEVSKNFSRWKIVEVKEL